MSKPLSLNVDYLNLEINNETIRKLDKCERGTQSNTVEKIDIATDSIRVSSTPPRRPPPLQLKQLSSIEQDNLSVKSSIQVARGGTLKKKIKGIRKGTAKISKELYATMTKVLENGFSKRKVKKTSMNSPLLKCNTISLNEKDMRHNTVITKGHTLPLIQSPKDTACSSKSASFFVPEIAPQSTKGTSCVPVQEQIFQSSILSTYPIMSLLEEYMKENVDEVDENSTDELFEHWISEFVDTCQRQIKTIILTTNDKLSRHIDLSNMTHLSGQEQVVKISSIPMWTQVRILEDSSNQKYIALVCV